MKKPLRAITSELGLTGQVNDVMFSHLSETGSLADKLAAASARAGAAVVQLVTAGMPGGVDWTNQTTDSSAISSASQITARAVITVSDYTTASGIIWEGGGSSVGTMLYIHQGKVYLHAADGREILSSDSLNMEYELSSNGQITIETVLTKTLGALYVNGEEVDRATSGGGEDLTGVDVGGIGKVYSSVPRNYPNWTGVGQGAFNETIDECTVWKNQIPEGWS